MTGRRDMPGDERGAVRRSFGWGMLDQGLSSATNFGGSLLAARLLPADGFGVVSIGFAVYLVILGVSRAWGSEPLVVRYSAEVGAGRERAIAVAAGTTSVLALTGTVLLLAVALLIRGATGPVLVALAVLLPGLLIQDLWRFALIMTNRPGAAAVNDLLWLGMMLSFALVLGPGPPPSTVLACWGAGATAGALLGAVQLRCRPVMDLRVWWSQHRDLGLRYLAETMLTTGATYVLTMGVALVDGYDAAAGLRGVQLVMGPMTVVFLGVTAQALPHLVRRASVSPHRVVPVARRISLTLVAAVVLYAAMVALVPPAWGVQMLGETWPAARALVPVSAGLYVVVGLSIGGMLGLRALGDARRSLRIRMLLGPATAVLGILGTVAAGSQGALAGLGAAHALGSIGWWLALPRSVRDTGHRERAVPPTARVPVP